MTREQDSRTKEKIKKKSPLEILASAAAMVSPKEFELPRELQVPMMFPGSSKTDYVSGRRGRYGNFSNTSKQNIIYFYNSFSSLLISIRMPCDSQSIN